MKIKLFLLVFFALIAGFANAQIAIVKYYQFGAKADSLLKAKNYKEAAANYEQAFAMTGWQATPEVFYNAARAWSMMGNADSAFPNLYNSTMNGNYMNPALVLADTDLLPLHPDKRWPVWMDTLKRNKERADANFNFPLVYELDSIGTNDQKYRKITAGVTRDSAWIATHRSFLRMAIRQDSVDRVQVTAILDKYGWLGADVVGEKGNATLFSVIQHSGLKTQEKYLPMLKEAVQNHKAKADNLALLTDRIEMHHGRPQVYGSQITEDDKGNLIEYQMIDEKNVDKRRAELGLVPLEVYAKKFGIDYKLPAN